MHKSFFYILLIALSLGACGGEKSEVAAPSSETVDYLDYSGLPEQATGGTRMIPIETEYGNFNVWTRRVGNNPTMKVLLLHGGPAATHEYLLNFAGYLPAAGVEFYYYDQLGSYYSDQPDDVRLWTVPRFVDEVEQVRKALGLNSDNFYLYGHSWGGLLAIEYALEYPQHLKGMIVSNMMSSIPQYNAYAENVIKPGLPAEVVDEVEALEAAEDYANPRYEELLFEHHYTKHILRRPLQEWPVDLMRAFKHLNHPVYMLMQGPSELGAGGLLAEWDRMDDLSDINVPTLVMAAEYDTMDPAHMEWMSEEFPQGRYHVCPDAGHMAHHDAPGCYFPALIEFIKDVD